MKKDNVNDKTSTKWAGNYTRGAIREFEENIVAEKDYLEKVDRALNNPRH